MQKISVLLVDDHTVVRQGLRALLAVEPDMEIVGEADDGRLAVQCAREMKPDVVVMDVAMPHLNGMEATRQIARAHPRIRVLVLSSYSEIEMVEQVVEAGAAGYLPKHTAAGELLDAIRTVHCGKAYFNPSITKRLRDYRAAASATGVADRKRSGGLTAREAEVLQLIAEGLANKQMAAELRISIKTVEKHRQQVMNKLGIHDVAGLTRHALARGIIEPRKTL